MTDPIYPVPLPSPFGPFTLLDRIGTGGMAEIYLARHNTPERAAEPPLVIKRLLPELANNRTLVDLLIAEARVTSLLQHPNIVRIDGHGHVDGRYYIAMEYIDGPDLLALLAACTRAHIRMPTELALHVIAEVCRGLAHAHVAPDDTGNPLNIIHRDVSPSNILISSRGAIKIMDFGVARADLGMTAPERERGGLRGKIGYMSPEQVMSRPIDRRADLFALGIVLFEALTLKRLFVGANDVQTLMNIREADIDTRLARHSYIVKPIRDILRKALAKNPDERFQTASDFREAILDHMFQQRTRVTDDELASFVSQLMRPRQPTPSSPSMPAAEASRELESDAAPLPPPVVVDPLAGLRRADFSKASFHFRNRDGSLFGPINYAQLQGLINEFAVSPGDLVSINDSDWLRIRDIPALVAAQAQAHVARRRQMPLL
jgi:serine/threonine protein kinase